MTDIEPYRGDIEPRRPRTPAKPVTGPNAVVLIGGTGLVLGVGLLGGALVAMFPIILAIGVSSALLIAAAALIVRHTITTAATGHNERIRYHQTTTTTTSYSADRWN